MSDDAFTGILTGVALTLSSGCLLFLWENLHVRKAGRGARDNYGQPLAWGLWGFFFAGWFITLLMELL